MIYFRSPQRLPNTFFLIYWNATYLLVYSHFITMYQSIFLLFAIQKWLASLLDFIIVFLFFFFCLLREWEHKRIEFPHLFVFSFFLQYSYISALTGLGGAEKKPDAPSSDQSKPIEVTTTKPSKDAGDKPAPTKKSEGNNFYSFLKR